MASSEYTEDDIKSLDWREHIRLRPGMYIGKLGDGSLEDDGIYVLLKEVMDNSIDEFAMGNGKKIEIHINEESGEVVVRDYGRGIPLGKLRECAAEMNTGAKYDSAAFKKSVGLNGVGIKAVNALSESFVIQAWRDGNTRICQFKRGDLVEDSGEQTAEGKNGTQVSFWVDKSVFPEKTFWRLEIVARMVRYYSYLNRGLTVVFNGKKTKSDGGLVDLLSEELDESPLYSFCHVVEGDIEIAFTHAQTYGEELFSFVNGQHTTMGGTHLSAFREALVKVLREHFDKPFDAADVRQGVAAAIAVKVEEPVFESQTKTKLGSTHFAPDGLTIRTGILNFVQQHVDNWLHQNPESAKVMLRRIQTAEKERKELKGIRKLARESAKKAKVHNKKLRDCKIHRGDKHERALETTIFITEGASASGPITQARDVMTQAIFSLKGKPLNSFGLGRKIVYQNEEMNLLQHALDIEESLENLRYEKVVLATDADVDGMHIRLLLLTFFLQFFPDLVKRGHVFILETPLFRVRTKKETVYCYSEKERDDSVQKLGKQAEITRFKGLGEISPSEFGQFIGPQMRLDPVVFSYGRSLQEILAFYMGKNTPQRQRYIVDNLRVELDLAETEDLLQK